MTKESALTVCRDEIHLTIPSNEEAPCTITFKGDKRLGYEKTVGIIDRYLAEALKLVLEDKEI